MESSILSIAAVTVCSLPPLLRVRRNHIGRGCGGVVVLSREPRTGRLIEFAATIHCKIGGSTFFSHDGLMVGARFRTVCVLASVVAATFPVTTTNGPAAHGRSDRDL